jgi:hypothetical protein
MKNLKNGIFPLEEIYAIIKICKKSNVTRFEYQGLVLSFSKEDGARLPRNSRKFFESKITPWGDEEHKARDEEAQLLISDPEAYEQVQIDRHLSREAILNEGEDS